MDITRLPTSKPAILTEVSRQPLFPLHCRSVYTSTSFDKALFGSRKRPATLTCNSSLNTEPYRGPNSPVSGYKLWLPGGGLVHVHATVDPSCTIEAAAVVQDGARLGKKCRIGSGSIVGPQVSIGNNSTLDHQVVVEHCSIGENCRIHSGAKIGGEGLILQQQPDGKLRRKKEGQRFRVEIRNRVEVGANSVVDRGTWRDTVLDKGCIIQPLAHIGHDSTIGRSCVVCSQVSIGASSALGDDVIVGCGAAVKDHVCIKANSRIAARSGVVRDIDTAGDYAGYPAMPADDFKHQVAATIAAQRQTPDDSSSGALNKAPSSSELSPAA